MAGARAAWAGWHLGGASFGHSSQPGDNIFWSTGAGHPQVRSSEDYMGGGVHQKARFPPTLDPHLGYCPRPYQEGCFQEVMKERSRKGGTGFLFLPGLYWGAGDVVGQGWSLSSKPALPPDLHSQVPQVGKCLLTQRGAPPSSACDSSIVAPGRLCGRWREKSEDQPETHPTLVTQPRARRDPLCPQHTWS